VLTGNYHDPEPRSKARFLSENLPEASADPVAFDCRADPLRSHQPEAGMERISLIEAGKEESATGSAFSLFPDGPEFRSARQAVGRRKTLTGFPGNQ